MFKKPLLSVILIVHNMQREAPRTITSLRPDYQQQVNEKDIEVIVVENGSTHRLDEKQVVSNGKNFSYFYLENPPPSPAYAINFGVKKARGKYICIMIDGACISTPGIFRMAFKAFKAFDNPVIMTRYFFLGPGRQNDTIHEGYTKETEDNLLKKINWPENGYRLFEIGSPLPTPKLKKPIPDKAKVIWFSRMFESNCLFLKKTTFHEFGGCDERFNIPGGGYLNLDTYREAARVEGTELVQLIGEGVFHQLHGGTTTNISLEDKKKELALYKEQYQQIREKDFSVSQKPVYFLGHMPNFHAMRHSRI
ncbi:MAG: glycosyltransferase family 2 protein [Desulfobacterales bacterium]|nr:glycosyltransferase family 2 protein [Desulfobacterales bacterium]